MRCLFFLYAGNSARKGQFYIWLDRTSHRKTGAKIDASSDVCNRKGKPRGSARRRWEAVSGVGVALRKLSIPWLKSQLEILLNEKMLITTWNKKFSEVKRKFLKTSTEVGHFIFYSLHWVGAMCLGTMYSVSNVLFLQLGNHIGKVRIGRCDSRCRVTGQV